MSLLDNMSAKDLLELSATIDRMLAPVNAAITEGNEGIAAMNAANVRIDAWLLRAEKRLDALEAAAEPVHVIIGDRPIKDVAVRSVREAIIAREITPVDP